MKDEFDLSGKVAMIVGAGQSWLEQLAISLLEAGATVIALGKDKEEMPALVNLAESLSRQVEIMKPVLNYETVHRIVEDGISRWRSLDILVNSLNIKFAKPTLEVTDEEWGKVIATNLSTAFTTCQVAASYMLKQKSGKIINITSCLGERSMFNSAAYCAAAGGVIQLTRALALEWASSGITVNAIAQGWILDASELSDERIARFIPLRRYGRPDELTSLLIYLASSASAYVTGQVYTVDGGIMARA